MEDYVRCEKEGTKQTNPIGLAHFIHTNGTMGMSVSHCCMSSEVATPFYPELNPNGVKYAYAYVTPINAMECNLRQSYVSILYKVTSQRKVNAIENCHDARSTTHTSVTMQVVAGSRARQQRAQLM